MLIQGKLCTLWLLLLLHDSGDTTKFKLFRDPARQSQPQDGAVRLFGSQSNSEGRVEVYHNGEWGTVCDDGWDQAEAQVVCRQLQFPGAKSVVIGKNYGQASGPIWLDDIQCKGSENQLSDCAFKSWGVTDCSHKEDVGVICETSYTADTNVTISNSVHKLDHSISLSDELGQIFDSKDHCDFIILVQSPTGYKQEDGTPAMDQTTLCTHKMFLSHFPRFNASEEMTNITVTVSQFCQPHFTSFIRYIYTRKVDVTFSSVQCLHWMASKFGVKQLMEDMGRLFSNILPEDATFNTQVSLYYYAQETGDMVLQENCIQYLAWNYQNLTKSPVWTGLSTELLRALLARSDLVVPDEYFLLQTVESWIAEKGNSISLETQADLLGLVRFPMIPAEKLYELESVSPLYSTHKNLYQENMLTALQFNVLLFSNLTANPKFKIEDDDYQPRIYTAEPWCLAIDPSKAMRNDYVHYDYRYGSYSQHPTKSFTTPTHNSLIFRSNTISWEANVFTSQSACSNRGLRCESFPVARLIPQYRVTQQSNIIFRNRLLLMCQGKYICQVQDFKDNMAYIAANETQGVAYPCPDDKYNYQFVVRPEYV